MTMKKKLSITVLLAILMVAALTTAFGLRAVSASETAIGETEFYSDGAAIRYRAGENDETGDGIRFTFLLDKAAADVALGEELAGMAESGILIKPADLVSAGGLTTADELAAKRTLTAEDWAISRENYTATAYLWGIPADSYDRDITARAYIKTADGEEIYSAPISRSIAYVALAAYNDKETTAEQKESLETYLKADYTVTYCNDDGTQISTEKIDRYGSPAKEIPAPEKTAEDGFYLFDKWVTEQGGTEEADLSAITGDITVYASYAGIFVPYQNVADAETELFGVFADQTEQPASPVFGTDNGITFNGNALKVEVGEKWYPYYVLDYEYALAMAEIYDGVSFDVYLVYHTALPAGVGASDSDKMVIVNPNRWTTLTLDKAALIGGGTSEDHWGASHGRLINNDAEGARRPFTIYFDNVRGIFNEESAVISESIDYTDKINGILNALGATEKTLTILYNGEKTDNVTREGYMFTSQLEGTYIVQLTIQKDGYYDYTIELPLEFGKKTFLPYQLEEELETKVISFTNLGTNGIHTGEEGSTGIKEGSRSMYVTTSIDDGYPIYKIDDAYARAVAKLYDGIKVDVFHTGKETHKYATGVDWLADLVDIAPNTWTTLTFTSENIAADTELAWCMFNTDYNTLEIYTAYFDNLRPYFDTRTLKLGETFDFTERLETFLSEFAGATYSVTVKDGNGASVTEGVAAEGVSFTPTAAGEYTVSVTLTCENYYDLTLNIPVSVTAVE